MCFLLDVVDLGVSVLSSHQDFVIQFVPFLLYYHIVNLINPGLIFLLPIIDLFHLFLPILDDLGPDHLCLLLSLHVFFQNFGRAVDPFHRSIFQIFRGLGPAANLLILMELPNDVFQFTLVWRNLNYLSLG